MVVPAVGVSFEGALIATGAALVVLILLFVLGKKKK